MNALPWGSLLLRATLLAGLTLYFTGCAAAPPAPEAIAEDTPPYDFFAPPTDAELEAQFAAADTAPTAPEQLRGWWGIPVNERGMPLECAALPEAKRPHCWHAYHLRGPEMFHFDAPCDYDFECNKGQSKMSCSYALNKDKPWTKQCTFTMPKEN